MQATACSQRLELLVPNLGTIGYHCKELPVPKDWNSWFPTWELWVTIARKCRVLFCLLVRYTTLCFAYWSGKRRFVLLIGPVQNALFCLMVRYRTFCFAYWSGTGRFVFGYWSGARRFVLLIGPVQNALFCLLVRYRTLCFA